MVTNLNPATVAIPLLAFILVVSVPSVAGGGFLRNAAYDSFGEDLQLALGEVMGCGGAIEAGRLEGIERALKPLWRSLPKNTKGHIDWRSLRYITHRYFMRQSSLVVRGFEPLRLMNTSDAGILSKQIPGYVDIMLGGKHEQDGFSLEDSTNLVATLEQLIFDSETHLLEKVYDHLSVMHKDTLDFSQLKSILETYMVHWMMGDDQSSIDMLMKNKTLLETVFPHWENLKSFVGGRIQALNFQRTNMPGSTPGAKLFQQQYSFDDAHTVVGGITRSFQSYWESECENMKTSLVALDRAKTGRVHLSDFYHAGMNSEWRFGESEAYLREMGVLDESAMWHGSQVIISNYLQGSNNCIVSTAHYLVCCSNPCENILSDIETEIGSAMATPIQIIDIIGNMTTADDEPIRLSQMLVDQLGNVATTQGGKVPLHGRLFAQWLHYVFPYDCAFPHKSGAVSLATPLEFGDYVASKREMSKHARKRPQNHNATVTDALLMSQWSSEEELFVDYSLELQAPWEGRKAYPFIIVGLFVLALAALWASLSGNGKPAKVLELPLAGSGKSHWV